MKFPLVMLAVILLSFAAGLIARPYFASRSEPPAVSPRAAEFDRFAGAFDMVLLGDSLTDRGRWHELTGLSVANRGIGRDTTAMAVKRLDAIKATSGPVFIMLGINDLVQGYPIDKITRDYGDLLDGLTGRRVVMQSVVGPAKYPVQELNNALRDLATSSGVEWLDLTPALDWPLAHTIDGVHLDGEGYRIWSEVLTGKL